MALTYTLGFKQAYIDAISPLFNSQKFQILDASNNVLGEANMPADVFGNANATPEAALTATFDISITTGGTATKFRAFIDAATNYQEGTIATSGADLNLAKVTFNVGDTVRIETWTLGFPA